MIEKVLIDRKTAIFSGCMIPFSQSHNGNNLCVNIFQGYNGPYSHFAVKKGSKLRSLIYDDTFSLDFAVPFGTPVIAALDGVVLGAVTRFCHSYKGFDLERGLHIFSNLIVLQHDKDLFSVYSHIAHNGLCVDVNAFVKKGQQIGFTGDVGWVGPVPHLHFALYSEPETIFGRLTIPVLFDNYCGELEHSLLHKN